MDANNGSIPVPASGRASALAAALDTSDAAVAGVLLAMLERSGVLLAFKEIASGRYVHVNAAMAQLFGRSPEAMVGATDADLMDAALAASIRVAEHAALAHSATAPSEQRFDQGGARRIFSVGRIAVPRADGAAPRHLLSVWTEQTALQQRESQLQQAFRQLEQQQLAAEIAQREIQDQTLRDTITGLYQRAHFDDQLRREVDLSSREHREFALVSIALDPPQASAAGLGDEARTRVLEALGQLLRGNTRAMDASCRIDGDHFAVLLSGVGLATAHSRMEGLRRQCATQIVVLGGRDLGFTVSMGVASFPHTAHSVDELLAAADQALTEAVKRGGNHVTLASIRFESG